MSNSLTHPVMTGWAEAHGAQASADVPPLEQAAEAIPSLLTRGDFAYTHSRIIRARTTHECSRCDELIQRGEKYLRYRLSIEFGNALHLACADLRSENGSLAYDCHALRLELNLPLRSAP